MPACGRYTLCFKGEEATKAAGKASFTRVRVDFVDIMQLLFYLPMNCMPA